MKLVRVEELSIEEIASFYSDNGEHPFEWYAYKFKVLRDNGRLVGCLLVEDNGTTIAAAYLGILQKVLSFPSGNSYQSIDTMVGIKYRGSQALARVSREYYKMMREYKAGFVFGIPNARIKSFREKILGWNVSSQIYRQIIPIPLLIFRFLDAIYQFFVPNDKSAEPAPGFSAIEDLIVGRPVIYVHTEDFSCVFEESGTTSCVGAIRLKREKISFFDRIKICLVLSRFAKGHFLQTYSTFDSPTSKIFWPISVRLAGLYLSGRFIELEKKFPKISFEYVEFDNFGFNHG